MRYIAIKTFKSIQVLQVSRCTYVFCINMVISLFACDIFVIHSVTVYDRKCILNHISIFM